MAIVYSPLILRKHGVTTLFTFVNLCGVVQLQISEDLGKLSIVTQYYYFKRTLFHGKASHPHSLLDLSYEYCNSKRSLKSIRSFLATPRPNKKFRISLRWLQTSLTIKITSIFSRVLQGSIPKTDKLSCQVAWNPKRNQDQK